MERRWRGGEGRPPRTPGTEFDLVLPVKGNEKKFLPMVERTGERRIKGGDNGLD